MRPHHSTASPCGVMGAALHRVARALKCGLRGGLRGGLSSWLAWALLTGALPAQAKGSPPERPVQTVTLAITGPTLIAVLPPEASDTTQEGAGELQAHLRFALTDTRRCLGRKAVAVHWVFADRVTVTDATPHPGADRTYDFGPATGGDGGVLLVQPKRAGREVHSPTGASGLVQGVPQAAAEYWRVKACRRG